MKLSETSREVSEIVAKMKDAEKTKKMIKIEKRTQKIKSSGAKNVMKRIEN